MRKYLLINEKTDGLFYKGVTMRIITVQEYTLL